MAKSQNVIRVKKIGSLTVFHVVKMEAISPFITPVMWQHGKRYLRAQDGTPFFINGELPQFKQPIN